MVARTKNPSSSSFLHGSKASVPVSSKPGAVAQPGFPDAIGNDPTTGKHGSSDRLAEQVALELQEQEFDVAVHDLGAAIDLAKYDSLVSLLYGPACTLRPHVDKGLHGPDRG